MTKQEEFSRNLRNLAEWYDKHPTVKTPATINLSFAVTDFAATPEEIRSIGAGRKVYNETWFEYIPEGVGFELRFLEYRDRVCVRKVIGTKIEPAVTIPAKPAEPEKTLPEREVEIVEWECPGSLLAQESEAVNALS